jgi:myo-inositol catabolism protein IolS
LSETNFGAMAPLIPRRRLSNTDLDVSVLCLGTWNFGGTQEQPDATHGFVAGGQAAVNDIVGKAFEVGINFFDTAEAYADHAAERALGEALRASGRSRNEYVVASKFGRHKGACDVKYDGAAVRSALSDTLAALGLEYLDLYQVHWSGNMVDAATVASVLASLQKEGLIRHYGVCNFGVSQMAAFDAATQACGAPAACTNQLPYNLLWRAIEFEIVPRHRQDGRSILAYGPFQEGLLCAKYKSVSDVPMGRRRTKHFAMATSELSRHGGAGAEEATFGAIATFLRACEAGGISPMHAAIGWLVRNEIVTSVVMGCSSVSQVVMNSEAFNAHGEPYLSNEQALTLSAATEELKLALGADADMWGNPSRVI